MIAVDTSALMAIVLGEAEADACVKILEAETEALVSAGTVAKALIVAARRNVGEEMASLIDGLGFEIVTRRTVKPLSTNCGNASFPPRDRPASGRRCC